MILTLTINPSIDRTITVDKLAFEDRGYILDHSHGAGGRGINASQVIRAFGGETLALLTSGGEIGKHIEEVLEEAGFPFETVRVKAESRVNMTISGQQGLTVKLNERGAALEPAEVDAVRELVKARLPKARWLMLCGSLQPGVPVRFYAEIVELAKEHGVKTLVDTDGDALMAALDARPTLVSPNQQESERLLGRAILTRSQLLEAATRICKMGADSVVLSMGARGAIGCSELGLFEAIPPRIEALCPIGAGDALAAAFVWSLDNQWQKLKLPDGGKLTAKQRADERKAFLDALRWGVAAGTATAALPGTNFPTLEQTKAIYKKVDSHAVETSFA